MINKLSTLLATLLASGVMCASAASVVRTSLSTPNPPATPNRPHDVLNVRSAADRHASGKPRGMVPDSSPDAVGPNHRRWIIPSPETTQPPGTATGDEWNSSQPRARQHAVIEIGTGMNYWDGDQWVPSNPSLEAKQGGFVAERLQYKVRLSEELNVTKAVSIRTRDGVVLNSTPLAIGLYDPVTDRSAILAELQDCVGVMLTTNQVLYENAFHTDGVRADVIYTIDKGCFSQDVVLTSRIDPADYGFPASSRVQIYTEFYDAPEPERIVTPVRVEMDKGLRSRMVTPDLVDEVLGFGEFVLGTGRASTAATIADASGEPAAPVVKQFQTLKDGLNVVRRVLVESVEYSTIQRELQNLPKFAGAPPKAGVRRESLHAGLFSRHLFSTTPPRATGTPARALQMALHKRTGVVIDYVATIGGTLTGNTVFAGDTTYFVSSPVYCPGAATIEGGAVFKYPHSLGGNSPTTAYIKVQSVLTCKTSSYSPAIFTAADDETIGDTMNGVWSNWTGATIDPATQQQKYYANPALWVYYLYYPTLSNLRFRFCQEAVRLEQHVQTSGATLAHLQILDCVRGVVLTGDGSSSGSGSAVPLTLNNALIARVQYPLTINAPAYGNRLAHCTIDSSIRMVTAPAAGSFYITTSICSNIPTLSSGGPTILGKCNGFFNCPTQFGIECKQDTQSPFAPTGPNDGSGNIYVANGQGAYYLRELSPFIDVGCDVIDPTLKNDIRQRTTAVPSDLFFDDINSSTTLGQTDIRDIDKADLGYHYPSIDYIVNGATVNNCTLNIDQGTVLALAGPFCNWGIRLNPGGRLNVNGVPTNHVFFPHLEAIQECPNLLMAPWGPTITWRELHFTAGFPTPFPEASLTYADFPTVAGNVNAHLDAISTYLGFTYSIIANLTIDGCLFQGGWLDYDDGGPNGRTFTVRNSIFDRASFFLSNWGGYAAHFYLQPFHANVLVANNLFYNAGLAISSVPGNTWTFIDNIFDHAMFAEDNLGNMLNGTVANNHHNAYVGMTSRLSPAAPTSTDPNLATLSYQSGALGTFYIAPTTSALVDKGSRSSADAGLYQFTSFTSNAKEAGTVANIGPHYLALVNGKPSDYDADGIADLIEDRNGDGASNSNESSWTAQNTADLTLISPLNNGTVTAWCRSCLP